MEKRDFLSIKEFANEIGSHPNTVRRAIYSGKINAFRLGKGPRSPFRIPRTEINHMAIEDMEAIIEKLIEKKMKNN